MKIICAWCNKEIKADDQPVGSSGFEVSHGMCQECAEQFLANESLTLEEFLNRLDAPVLMVNEDVEVLLANDQALQILGKNLETVKGFRSGDALECAHARLPEGCGRTIHCKTCTIRISVTETFKTGKCFRRVPAYLDRADRDAVQRIGFLISTEKVGDVVLLRVDTVIPEGENL